MIGKSKLFLCVISMLVVVAVLVGCSSTPTPTAKPSPSPTTAAPSPTASPKPTTSPTASPKPTTPSPTPSPTVTLTIKGETGMPQNNNMNSITPTALTDAIAKATNGRVATKWSYGGGIVSYGEILDAVSKGVIDIGPMYIGYKPAVFRMTAALSTFLDLSMAYGKFTALDSWRLTNQLWKEFPEFDQEFTKFNVKVLLPIPADDYMMLTSKPVSKFEDLKGLKLRAPGEYLAKLFGPAGATPVTVAFADVYTSLQTKLIDGVYSNIDSMDASKFYEPAPYASHLGSHIVLAVTYVSMNLDTWKKISPADQKAILDAAAALPGDGQDKKSAQVIAKWKADPKVTTTFWPQSEIDKWVKVSPDWYALLAADLNKAGLPGTKVTTRMKELVTQYMAEKK